MGENGHCGNGSDAASMSNPAKYDDWIDLGRRCNLSADTADSNNVPRDQTDMIERCAAMLEDILATALDHDAHTSSSAAEETHARYCDTMAMTPALRSQIKIYVRHIASKYNNVGFHSFEHASHVMLSATKIIYMLQESSRAREESNNTNNDSEGADAIELARELLSWVGL